MTAYIEGNPRTKKRLKEMLDQGERPAVFSPGPFPAEKNGVETISGPHFPQPHTWYARVRVEDGRAVKILS